MVELRRRARGPPVDSRDDHPTTASGLDRTNTQPHNTTVSNTAADHEAPAEKPRRVLSRSPEYAPCWATSALSTWQRTGRWDPTPPLPATQVWEACGGCMLYDLIPNMPEVRLRPLMQHFAEVMQRSSAIQSLVAVP